MAGLDLCMTEVAYNTQPQDYSVPTKKEGFKQKFCFHFEVDIENLMWKWQNKAEIVNTLREYLTFEEYALINMIVGEGLMDILGQEPAEDEPIEDDPYADPSLNTPNLNPDNPADDDPFAHTPSWWETGKEVFFDDATGNLIDENGDVLLEAAEKAEHPYWKDWVTFYMQQFPEDLDIPSVPEEPDEDNLFEAFMTWMSDKYGDAGIAGGELDTPMML